MIVILTYKEYQAKYYDSHTNTPTVYYTLYNRMGQKIKILSKLSDYPGYIVLRKQGKKLDIFFYFLVAFCVFAA